MPRQPPSQFKLEGLECEAEGASNSIACALKYQHTRDTPGSLRHGVATQGQTKPPYFISDKAPTAACAAIESAHARSLSSSAFDGKKIRGNLPRTSAHQEQSRRRFLALKMSGNLERDAPASIDEFTRDEFTQVSAAAELVRSFGPLRLSVSSGPYIRPRQTGQATRAHGRIARRNPPLASPRSRRPPTFLRIRGIELVRQPRRACQHTRQAQSAWLADRARG